MQPKWHNKNDKKTKNGQKKNERNECKRTRKRKTKKIAFFSVCAHRRFPSFSFKLRCILGRTYIPLPWTQLNSKLNYCIVCVCVYVCAWSALESGIAWLIRGPSQTNNNFMHKIIIKIISPHAYKSRSASAMRSNNEQPSVIARTGRIIFGLSKRQEWLFLRSKNFNST